LSKKTASCSWRKKGKRPGNSAVSPKKIRFAQLRSFFRNRVLLEKKQAGPEKKIFAGARFFSGGEQLK
jgi:hypothetical protein